MTKINQILIERLEKKGMAPGTIPGFIKSLANIFSHDPNVSLSAVNFQLHNLGWADIDLDDHTLQLAIACFEAEGFQSQEKFPVSWFECNYIPSRTCEMTTHEG